MSVLRKSIYSFFENSRLQYPENPALFVDGQFVSYSSLNHYASLIASTLLQCACEGQFVGFLAHRSLTAYSSVLGILKSGKGYVPLNPKFPVNRTLSILEASGINILVVGHEAREHSIALLRGCRKRITVILTFDKNELPEDIRESENLNLIGLKLVVTGTNPPETIEAGSSDYAYLLFTSGSTGEPKGVPISHENVSSYIHYLLARYCPSSSDRFSQTFDLTFDLSVHDMFMCWSAGAALYCIPEKQLMGPAKFIKEHELTFWFSVPSLGLFMSRFRMLKDNAFPHLKLTLFCGEPLPESLVRQWMLSAPNSIVENIYGPTEATIGITHYPCNAQQVIKSWNGIVSIGRIFESQSYRIIDELLQDVEPGETGELCLSGTQVTSHYWNNSQATDNSFIRFPDSNKLWYKTGDLVSIDHEGDIFYKSRKDHQVKVLGHRVELEEINSVLKKITSENSVVTIPYPVNNGIAQGLYSFFTRDCKRGEKEIIASCRELLPDYMIPKRILFIDDFPLNANGKIDRSALNKLIENDVEKAN